MRLDHRPYYIMKLFHNFELWYIKRFIQPQLDKLGSHPKFMKPWHLHIFGPNIRLGEQVHIVAAPDRNVRLSVWTFENQSGQIDIGDYCLICPGVRIDSAQHIEIGANSMIASGAYLTDADWHGIYDRTQIIGKSAKIHLEENVWIGDQATICKGVTIGKNSIVGASAVVTKNVPANVIVAGNPAQLVRELDPSETLRVRAELLAEFHQLDKELEDIRHELLDSNTLFSWLRSIFKPRSTD
ncbi:MAG: acyltransferase [Pseudomonadales bacterium]|nr:acyltransferase [Pseudomonadales bacterium]